MENLRAVAFDNRPSQQRAGSAGRPRTAYAVKSSTRPAVRGVRFRLCRASFAILHSGKRNPYESHHRENDPGPEFISGKLPYAVLQKIQGNDERPEVAVGCLKHGSILHRVPPKENGCDRNPRAWRGCRPSVFTEPEIFWRKRSATVNLRRRKSGSGLDHRALKPAALRLAQRSR